MDIINFKADRKYKLLISISTLEHIGYDEEEKNLQKQRMHLLNLLNL